MCLLFLCQGGNIVCIVTGHRRYSQDLPQGGLEIPCTLSFSGESTYIEKAKHCLRGVSAEISVHVNTSDNTKENSKVVNATPISKEKTEVVNIAETDELMPQSMPIWLQREKITLHFTHKEIILQGSMLNDVIINAAQVILKEQFPDLLGFQSTLLLKKEQPRYQSEKVYIQIIFD